MKFEAAFLLDKNIEFYENIIYNARGEKVLILETHDIYWSNKELKNLSETQIKKNCIRLREVRKLWEKDGKPDLNVKRGFRNYNLVDNNITDKILKCDNLELHEQLFYQKGFKKVFDTKKIDNQYKIGNMKSGIQLQQIDNIGLVLYYDNPDYYDKDLKEQETLLIQELNSYGFNFSKNEKNVDKLRSLYNDKITYRDY